jgi:ribonuclease HI
MVEWQENQLPTPTERLEHWVMYFDSSLKLEGAGAGVLLISPTGEQLKYVLQIFWKVSTNEAEYEALLHELRLAASLGIKGLLVYDDSAVVINQVNKSWDRNKENMDAYFLEVRKLENKFYGLEFHHVVRNNNIAADVLSKLGSTRAQVPTGVFVDELRAPSIPEPVLTPKFGKESDLWVRFEKESIWWKEGYFQRFSAKRSAVGYLLRFGKGTVELILRDWTVTWLNQGRRMDG